MTLIRLLLLALIVWAGYWIIRSYLRSLRRGDQPYATQDLVQCAHCGVNLPRNESLSAEGKFYCSSEHKKLAE
ncbi:MAG: PP0621 family protein [Burkholderiales bacterium]